MAVTISMNGIIIQIFHRNPIKHFHIHGALGLVTEHGLYLQSGTMIIALIITSESTIQYVIVDVHRFLLTLRHGHINNHDNIFIVTYFINLHIIFRQKINIYLLRIVHIIPKFLTKLRCILETGSFPTTIFIFFNTKNNDSTIAICKGGIGVPQRNRQTTFCFFHFSSVVFSVFIKL